MEPLFSDLSFALIISKFHVCDKDQVFTCSVTNINTSHADGTIIILTNLLNSSASTVTVTLSPTYITNNKHGHLSQHAACRWVHARPQGRWSDLARDDAALDPTRTHMHLLLQITIHDMLSWPLYNAN